MTLFLFVFLCGSDSTALSSVFIHDYFLLQWLQKEFFKIITLTTTFTKNFIHKFFAGFGFFRKDQVSVVTSIIALKDLDVANALGV